MIRTKLYSILFIILFIILLPYLITIILSDKVKKEENTLENQKKVVSIQSEKGKEKVDLDTYIVSVVAAEMPANFELESLKAQAVAVRTYTIRHTKDKENINSNELKQSCMSIDKMKEVWGSQYSNNYNKILKAVESTKDEIMVYNKEPIEAVFHSTSAGKTQSAKDIWSKEIPYLVSVDSSEDKNAKEYLHTIELSKDDIIKKIRDNVSDFAIYTDNILENMQIIERSEAGYIKSIQIGNKIFTGEEIRKYLGLYSSNFTIDTMDNGLKFTCRGYGHGVGLSQNGANYKAKKGLDYKQILTHYYPNIKIIKMENIE